jgi:hypothetical protein
MTARVFVHIGPHKTGTTYLQSVLEHNREALAADGVLFASAAYEDQRAAVQELKHHPGRSTREGAASRWGAVAAEVADWPGELAVVSHEGLAGATGHAIRRLVESFAPAQVHVLYGCRDLARVLTGSWQTHIRNGRAATWPAYLAAVRGEADWDPKFWRGQDPREVFERWERFVPRERIHVLTVPPSGAPQDLLWQRFCSVVGLDPGRYSLRVHRTYESAGSTETEVLRRVNERMGEDRDVFLRRVQRPVASRVLARRANALRGSLPAAEHGWLDERAGEIIGFLRDGGYEVTGDLDDLRPRTAEPSAPAPDAVDLADALDAATEVIAALLQDLRGTAGDPAGDPAGDIARAAAADPDG